MSLSPKNTGKWGYVCVRGGPDLTRPHAVTHTHASTYTLNHACTYTRSCAHTYAHTPRQPDLENYLRFLTSKNLANIFQAMTSMSLFSFALPRIGSIEFSFKKWVQTFMLFPIPTLMISPFPYSIHRNLHFRDLWSKYVSF